MTTRLGSMLSSHMVAEADAFYLADWAVLIAVVSTNPADLLGFGTWAAFLARGRVMVGLNSGDADFDTVEETGGTKTVTSTGTNSVPTFTGSALGAHIHTSGTIATSAHAGSAIADHTVTQPSAHADVLNHVHTLATGYRGTGKFFSSRRHGRYLVRRRRRRSDTTAVATISGNPTANGVASQAHADTAVAPMASRNRAPTRLAARRKASRRARRRAR